MKDGSCYYSYAFLEKLLINIYKVLKTEDLVKEWNWEIAQDYGSKKGVKANTQGEEVSSEDLESRAPYEGVDKDVVSWRIMNIW